MSTILKALRRLEQERDARVERGLRDQVVARPEAASGSGTRLRLPLIAAAGAVGAVLVVALVAAVERGGDETAPAPAPPLARSAPAFPRVREGRAPTAVPDAAARADARRAQGAPVASGLPHVATQPPPASEPMLRRAEPASEPPLRHTVVIATPPAANPPQVAVVARPAPPAPALPPPAVSLPAVSAPEPAAGVASPAPRAEPATEPAVPVAKTSTVAAKPPFQEEPAPLAHERVESAGPPELVARAVLPGVVVERTLWHPDAGRRLAVLQVEGRDEAVELREGDAVGDLVVQQIDPSGVLFLHRGVEIRQRVGARD